MQIQKIKTFNFEELSQSSKDRAVAKYLEGADFPWWRDCEASLRSFCDHFGVPDLDFSIGCWCPSYVTANPSNDNFRGLKLKDFADAEKLATTGYCEEIFMFEQFYKEWEKTGSPLLGFMYALAEGCKSIQKDMEYHQSEEYAIESIELNEYIFYEDGEIADIRDFLREEA